MPGRSSVCPGGTRGLEAPPPTSTVGFLSSLTSSPPPPNSRPCSEIPSFAPPLPSGYYLPSVLPLGSSEWNLPIKPLPVTPPPPPRLASPCPQVLVPEGHELEGRWASRVLRFLADRIWSPLGPALALPAPASPGPFLLYWLLHHRLCSCFLPQTSVPVGWLDLSGAVRRAQCS